MTTVNLRTLDSSVQGKAVVATPSFYAVLIAASASLGVFGGQLGWWELTEFQNIVAQTVSALAALIAFVERVFTNIKVTKVW